jgi:hypothetical protein
MMRLSALVEAASLKASDVFWATCGTVHRITQAAKKETSETVSS